jgi:hypothetical protein
MDAAQILADRGISLDHQSDDDRPATCQPSHREMTPTEWESDYTHAYLERRFDPSLQTCISAAANSCAAALLGLRREDLLAQLMREEMPLPLPPLDAVAVFLHALGTSRDAVATRYFRLVPAPAGNIGTTDSDALAQGEEVAGAGAILVCSISTKDFDGDGRLVKVHTPVLFPLLFN